METLYDLGIAVTKIREAINQLEVKGKQNASLVVYAFNKCDEIIEAINSISRKTMESSQNGEAGDENVGDSGAS